MRLVVLAGLLRQICAAQRAAKVVLFMSSCDAVEFVHQMFSEVFELVDGEPLLSTPIFKLHGNLAQVRRKLLSWSLDCRSVDRVGHPIGKVL